MASSEIKIFYSWQSDLPGSQTRNLIQDSIDTAVKAMRDTVEIIADRDTKGEFGSPDIVQTIFSKIDECDIFIADVSIINKYYPIDDHGNPANITKTSPNPNVLLELGYAAHALGWENIICIINEDYGEIEELPFDIRQRRLTPYSLKDKEKSDVKKALREIIASTVMNIQEKGKRVKGSLSNHTVGSYDFETRNVVKKLIPYDIAKSTWYGNERKRLLSNCKDLIEAIKEISISPTDQIDESAALPDGQEENKPIKLPNGLEIPAINKDIFKRILATNSVVIEKDDKNFIVRNAHKWFELDLSDDFFFLGNLRKKTAILLGDSTEYIGTKDEKNKHNKIIKLEYQMQSVILIEMFIKTFEGMYLLPLAIYNASAQVDKDITVSVKVHDNSAAIVSPTEDLIYEDIRGLEGLIYESKMIEGLLKMPETTDIHYDTDISFDINDSLRVMRNAPISLLGNTSPEFDAEDYEREIKKYIASPVNGGDSEVELYIKDLRPKENKWLGASLLVKPTTDKISFSYSIKSQYSSGDISGSLEFQVD